MALNEYDGEGSDDSGKPKVFDEFDCPLCNANNPYGDGFKENDEIRCFYCGQEYKVKISDNGKLKLKEF